MSPLSVCDGECADSHRLIGPLVRFYAHLILALRTLGESVPDAAANAIIQAYLKVLEMEGNDHLVAAYAACLRQGSGEESYARFLRCKLDAVHALSLGFTS